MPESSSGSLMVETPFGVGMFARIPVGETEDGLSVGQPPPSEAADKQPETVGDAGVKAVWGGECAAFGGRNGQASAMEFSFNSGQCVVFTDRCERACMTMMAGD